GAAGAARLAGTRLPSPPPDPRRRRAEALQIDPRDRLAGTARGWCECGRYPTDGRDCVSLWPPACPRGNLPPGGCDGETEDIRWQAAAWRQAHGAAALACASSARDRGAAGGCRP